ncbi:MAG: hypothetical protein ACJ75Z_08785 [Solirubrobacterales bacterium]
MTLAAVLAILLSLPAHANAAVTLGSNLLKPAVGSWGCGAAPCTGVQASLPGLVTVSPVNGTVTAWRVRGGNGTDTGRLRVLAPSADGASFSFTATSATQTVPSGTAVSTFPTSLPIAAGDLIGLDDDHAGGSSFGDAGGTGVKLIFQPTPGNGAALVPTFSGGGELLFNADVVPTNRFPKPKQPKSTPRGIDVLVVQVPNSGFLTAKNKKGNDLIRAITKTVSGAGFVKLKLKPSRAARAALRSVGKARGQIKVIFTPTGGSAFSRAAKATLRKV